MTSNKKHTFYKLLKTTKILTSIICLLTFIGIITILCFALYNIYSDPHKSITNSAVEILSYTLKLSNSTGDTQYISDLLTDITQCGKKDISRNFVTWYVKKAGKQIKFKRKKCSKHCTTIRRFDHDECAILYSNIEIFGSFPICDNWRKHWVFLKNNFFLQYCPSKKLNMASNSKSGINVNEFTQNEGPHLPSVALSTGIAAILLIFLACIMCCCCFVCFTTGSFAILKKSRHDAKRLSISNNRIRAGT